MNIVKENTDNVCVLIVDNSDISKPYSEMLDSLCKVRDGSTGKITTGYHLLEITALTKEHKMPKNLFDLMEKFAGYGFNKSHSAAYALISYQTAWLKKYYPAEFMAATLSSDMDSGVTL